jgi:hypothetical protein
MPISEEIETIKRDLEYARRDYPNSVVHREPYDAGKMTYYVKIAQIDTDRSYHNGIWLPVSEKVWKSRQLDELNENGRFN